MTTWYTSDWHLGHKNILHFGSGRPFASIEEHDTELVRRHNAVVAPSDTVVVLGDVAMGKIEESLALCKQMNGSKILVCGNHDRPAMTARRFDKMFSWIHRYREEGGFDGVWLEAPNTVELGDHSVLVSHYPYRGDSGEIDRFLDRRPVDTGGWLLHGHVHEAWRQRDKMINVGVDVWDFYPVSESKLAELITAAESGSTAAAGRR